MNQGLHYLFPPIAQSVSSNFLRFGLRGLLLHELDKPHLSVDAR